MCVCVCLSCSHVQAHNLRQRYQDTVLESTIPCVQTNEITYSLNGELKTDTIKAYLSDNFGYEPEWKWPAFVISLGFCIALRLVVAIATKYLNFTKR